MSKVYVISRIDGRDEEVIEIFSNETKAVEYVEQYIITQERNWYEWERIDKTSWKAGSCDWIFVKEWEVKE